jgi:[FeFe] hydrogenase H-cluster maturation GTPase HydF
MAILVERDNISIVGRMNAGKSSLINLLTQQQTSIVDAYPGTTADTKAALAEIHGIGPVRLMDTAGINETGILGDKKRKKVWQTIKESNLILLVIDPDQPDFSIEDALIREIRQQDCQLLVIYNLFSVHSQEKIAQVEHTLPLLRFHHKISLKANDPACRRPLLDFILAHYQSMAFTPELLPFIEKNQFYVLFIPMDEETPPGRYLRPQAMAEEYITRHWAYPVSYRPDLKAARSAQPAQERQRFTQFLQGFGQFPRCIITDSQAMDIIKDWCPPQIMLTTFSIMMIQYMSGGKLPAFVKGLQVLDQLKQNDAILITEACNHSRIGEDIGTVQIPRIMQERFPGVIIDHAFGREFQEKTDLKKYSLIIHCGGCILNRQKMTARIRDLEMVNIPYTNYGLFLSAIQGREALQKVLLPWNLK